MISRGAVSSCLLALAAWLAPMASARAQTDVIRGRVTTSDDMALPGVRVIATSIPGNVTREARTDNRGNFQIVFPGGTGDYMVGYALIGYVYRQQQVKRLADEEILIANTQLEVVQLDTVAVVAPVQQRVGRNQPTPDVSGTERPISADALPPDQQGDIAAMAASLPGVLLIPGIEGAPDGFSVLGLGADQNSVTLNGMETGLGGLPRDANVSTTLATSPYDPSRGGFSGANFNIRPGSGSNFRNRGMSMVLNTPQLQWTDRAASALGQEYTNVSLGGTASGPIVLNKAFYNASWQLGRQARDNQSLLGTSAVGLQTAGVAMDSVTRLLSILQQRGVPGLGGPVRDQALSDNGSVFGSVDISPPSSTSGNSFGFTFNGNWGRQRPAAGSATQLASAGGDRYNWGAGLQARHSAYVKMVLTETTVGTEMSRNHGSPYLDLPAGRVRVTSAFPDGRSGVQNLGFGGNQGLSSRSASNRVSFQNTLSWFDEANRHRVKLTTEARYSGSSNDPSNNLLGTFTFNSLEDLEAGIPASFTRTVSVRERSYGQYSASVALGDSYRRTPDLQLQYGVRVDATRYDARPPFNPAVLSAFGRRNDRLPTPIAVSPRIGFSWTVGQSNEIMAFFGQARRPRAVVRGGIGMFTNGGGGPVGSALDQTGLPSGIQQIVCVGPAAPAPLWDEYDDPSRIPAQCADGSAGSPFSNSSPNVTLFARDFAPQRSVRGNLSWGGAVLDGRFNATVEGSYSLNLNQQRNVDLNFDNVSRFTLADDGRPVYVAPTSIVPATGGIAARDARISSAFARVSEVRSDLRGRTAQAGLRLSPIARGPRAFTWSGAYTYTHVLEQVSGFASTASSPLGVEWARSAQGPHQISYNLRYLFFGAVSVNWSGSFRSGSAYTPMVAGDVNGDGYGNDRAFVYAPAAASDSAVARGMDELLSHAPRAARECLGRQLGRIAARNSCRGPWSSSASLNVSLDRARFRMPQRASVSFSLSNPLGAADLLVNGSGRLRGWGQTPSPDASLLYVRGFDAGTQRYRYEVNQRFGATRPQFMARRSPVVLTTSVRIDLGPTRERQSVEQWVGAGRTRPGARMPAAFFRNSGPNSVPNPLAVILRQQDTLQLTAGQADSIAVMNRRYTYRSDSLWAPVGQYLGSLGNAFNLDEAYDRYMRARRAQVDMLMRLAPAVNALLTPEQKRRLPPQVVNFLDHRYLLSIRNGTNTFVGGGGGFSGGFFPGDFSPGGFEVMIAR
jgi:hypothetical protein